MKVSGGPYWAIVNRKGKLFHYTISTKRKYAITKITGPRSMDHYCPVQENGTRETRWRILKQYGCKVIKIDLAFNIIINKP